MSLSDWKKNGWLRDHTPTKQEIALDIDLKKILPTTELYNLYLKY